MGIFTHISFFFAIFVYFRLVKPAKGGGAYGTVPLALIFGLRISTLDNNDKYIRLRNDIKDRP